MLKSLVLAALISGAAAVADKEVQAAFSDFIKKYARSYATEAERQARFEIFQKNYFFVQAENAKKSTYQLEINAFADQSPEDIKAGRLGLISPPRGNTSLPWVGMKHLGTDRYSGKALPTSVDWTTQGAVTPPKNQGQCGSCWTFSTTGALEGAWKIATGKLVSLSEQQFVDCSHDTPNSGCNGGNVDVAFTYGEGTKICTEDSYPYQAANGQCSTDSCTTGIPSGAIKGYKDVPQQDENALMEAVAKQPISIAIEADEMAFQLYKGGILQKECGNKLDHGVLLVGYGTEDGVDYWKVKNSWGASWGEEGYIRLERGISADGQCGIKDLPSYPVVEAELESVIV